MEEIKSMNEVEETKPRKDFEWYLQWSDIPDEPQTYGSAKCCSNFYIWRDSDAHLVTFDEATQLIAEKKLAPFASYWDIKPGRLGMICKTYYATTWSKQWEQISSSRTDYLRGWDDNEKRYKMLSDWDEALAIHAQKKADAKTVKRTIKVFVDFETYHQVDRSDKAKLIDQFSLIDLQCREVYRVRDHYQILLTAKENAQMMEVIKSAFMDYYSIGEPRDCQGYDCSERNYRPYSKYHSWHCEDRTRNHKELPEAD